MMTSTIKSKIWALARVLLVAAFFLAAWEIIAIIVGNSYFLPRVGETLVALKNILFSKDLPLILLTSVYRVFLGLLLGISAGVILATLSYRISAVRAVVSPLISIMKATPVAAIIVFLWISMSTTTLTVFIVFLMVTPIVWQNAYTAYGAVSRELSEVCDIFKLGYFERFRVLIFPTLLKYLIPAIITSVGLAWKAEIAAELMTYSNIGSSISDYKNLFYDTASVFAWCIIIVIMSLSLEKIAKILLERIRT